LKFFTRAIEDINFVARLQPQNVAQVTCLVGTLVQEIFASSPAVRDACAASIFGHASTLAADIGAAKQARRITADWAPESLARHTQTVIQGAFVLAKAANNIELARESLDHLDQYIRLLFHAGAGEEKPT